MSKNKFDNNKYNKKTNNIPYEIDEEWEEPSKNDYNGKRNNKKHKRDNDRKDHALDDWN